MQGVWKELNDAGEDEPLGAASKAPAAYAAAPVISEEAGFLETGLTLRSVTPQAMRNWSILQVVALIVQLMLWREVSGHLQEYDDVVSRECSLDHLRHGVCVGPMWNLSSYQDLVLPGKGWYSDKFDFVITGPSWANSKTVDFSIASSPPTFAIVVVPVSQAPAEAGMEAPKPVAELPTSGELSAVKWSLHVSRLNPPQVGQPWKTSKVGRDAATFEDLSMESHQAHDKEGRVRWSATLTNEASGEFTTRFLLIVEDATTKHLAEIHASPQCAFGRSWKAFNKQRQGHGHRALSWCQFLLGIFLVVGGAAVYLVHVELNSHAGKCEGHRFHAIIFAKFMLQDVPQQICLILYIFGWYDASGLRCQLCLFDPKHCSNEEAFHSLNVLAFGCTLMSAVANQLLLVRPVNKKEWTEDDLCFQQFLRVGMVCVAVLPFTTGLVWGSTSVVQMSLFFRLLLAIPCAVGWFALLIMACVPMLIWCADD